jgi:hypothetical protein
MGIQSLFLSGISLLLEVVKKDSEGTSLLSEFGNDGTARTNGLLDGTILIELGKTAPRTQVLSSVDHDHRDISLSTQGTDQLLVFLILAILGKAAKTSRAAVKSLGALVQALLETIVHERLLEHLQISKQEETKYEHNVYREEPLPKIGKTKRADNTSY